MANDRKLPALLLTGTLTVMAAAAIAPSLPAMERAFASVPDAAFWVRLALPLPALLTALAAPFAGLLLDRFGRRSVLLSAVLAYGVVGVAAGTASGSAHGLGVLLAFRALLGLAVAGILTGTTTLVTDYYRGIRRSEVLGIQSGVMAFGGVIFLLVGGWAADLHWRAPFLVYAAAFAFWPLAFRYLPEPARPRQASTQGIDEATGGDPSGVARAERPRTDAPARSEGSDPAPGGVDSSDADPDDAGPTRLARLALVGVYALALAGMTLFYVVPIQVPFHLEAIGVPGGGLAGLAIASATLCASLAALSYSRLRRRFSYRTLTCAQLLVTAAGLLALAATRTYPGVVASLAVVGLGSGPLVPNMNRWASDLAPAPVRGRVLGGLATALFTGQFLAPILTQPLVERLGLPGMFRTVALAAVPLGLLVGALAWWGRSGLGRAASTRVG